MSNGARRRQQSEVKRGVQALLPFPYSPLVRPLTGRDLESCVALEDAAFCDSAHRCSRDKLKYRLTTCSELSLGLFCTVVPSNAKGWEIDTLHTAHPVETGRRDGALSVLFAHIVATLSYDDVVTDAAIDYPRDYASKAANGNNSNGEKPKVGHRHGGRTVCIHSLAVHPKLQGVGIGKHIVMSYMERIGKSGLGDRFALICQGYLVNYYERFGFEHLGPSEATFGGSSWHDMIFNIAAIPRQTVYLPPPPTDPAARSRERLKQIEDLKSKRNKLGKERVNE
ncbi:acyl-CoA N-acyltransferase [Xylaria palmicola]|nr:acyl-CoA N-acyltransferase [Xylaria palmicola]